MESRYKEIKPGYRVSDDGRVFSCVLPGSRARLGATWHELRPHPLKNSGHLQVWLGRGDCRYVHTLVLEAFIGPCPPGMEACHFPDRNPANNRLENLRWGTRTENHADSRKHGTAYFMPGTHLGEDHPCVKLTEDSVRDIMTIRRQDGSGAKSICESLGIDTDMRGAVDGVIRGQSWNHVTGLAPYEPQSLTSGRRRAGRKASTTEIPKSATASPDHGRCPVRYSQLTFSWQMEN